MSFVGNCGTFTRGYKAMIMDVEFLYHLLYLLICALGLFVHEFFYSLLVGTRSALGMCCCPRVCEVRLYLGVSHAACFLHCAGRLRRRHSEPLAGEFAPEEIRGRLRDSCHIAAARACGQAEPFLFFSSILHTKCLRLNLVKIARYKACAAAVKVFSVSLCMAVLCSDLQGVEVF